MSNLNKCMIIGRLTSDPETRSTQGGTSVATLNVATNERFTDKNGQKQESVEYHRVIAWGRLAEICEQYLKKGSLCYFEGPIKTKEWTDKENVKRYTTEITALSMQMLGDTGGGQSRSNQSNQQSKPQAQQNNVGTENFDDMDDDLPF